MPDLHQPESGTVIETGEFQMNAAPVYKKQMSYIDDVALLDLSTCGVTPEYALEISGGSCGLDRQWAVPSFKLKVRLALILKLRVRLLTVVMATCCILRVMVYL
jgi:hypothetical protein